MLEHDSKLKEQDRIVSYIIRITSAFVLHTPLAYIFVDGSPKLPSLPRPIVVLTKSEVNPARRSRGRRNVRKHRSRGPRHQQSSCAPSRRVNLAIFDDPFEPDCLELPYDAHAHRVEQRRVPPTRSCYFGRF
ncbi:uncharacterized protein K489DRAFT_72619 [Dissoconium aciculare CBS 342.82]|uniref:Uncharacterized protein n=1 Tax=Dissoconium aciculare CBS 342.82 TaxID=1314786 RepID=A0A6J3LTF2_9PEZI|nr:uncharacterized protein K489DRAFT_72619 [Dissoconium aciculare CBS 342.82]KAF1819055.1 hypothetical protein K489DRAFT_72619 [Dissoconium aciculare CBS 342.82]